ncbi:MAG: hypothetical protein U1F43_01145 [Myxococcota bacterium]
MKTPTCVSTGASTFECRSTKRPDDASCDDADPCTVDETCTGGVCGGGVLPIDQDWSHPLAVGNAMGGTAVDIDEAGSVWWFVSVTQRETSFGLDPGGTPVTLTLDEGQQTGIGVVRFDPDGSPREARVLVSSIGDVRLPTTSRRPARTVRVAGHAARQLVVVGTFVGETRYPNEAGIQTEAVHTIGDRGYFVAEFDATNGRATRFIEIQSSAIVEDLKGTPLVVALGASGAAAVVVPVDQTRSAELRGVATAPPGDSITSWVLYLSQSGALAWEGEIKSPPFPATGFPITASAAMDDSGAVWLMGRVVGSGEWWLGDKGSPPFAATRAIDGFALRLGADGEYGALAQFAGTGGITLLDAAVDGPGQHFACAALFSADLVDVTGQEPHVLFPDDPLAATQLAVMALDATAKFRHAYRAPSANLVLQAFGAGSLIVSLLGSSELLDGEQSLFGAGAPGEIRLAGIPMDATTKPWAFDAARVPGDPSDASYFGLAVSPQVGFAIAVGSGDVLGPHLVGDPPASVDAGQAFVSLMNSRDGMACRSAR